MKTVTGNPHDDNFIDRVMKAALAVTTKHSEVRVTIERADHPHCFTELIGGWLVNQSLEIEASFFEWAKSLGKQEQSK